MKNARQKVWVVSIDVGHTDVSVHETQLGALKKAALHIRLECDPSTPPEISPEARIATLIDTASQSPLRDLRAALHAWNDWRNELDSGYIAIEECEVES